MAFDDLFPGGQVLIYVSREDEYGSATRVAGTDAFLSLSERLTPTEERMVRPDRSGSSDYLERVVGRRSASWQIDKLILPRGREELEPDDSLLWANLIGRADSGPTGVEYTQATAHTESLTLRRGIRTGTNGNGIADFQETLRGAIVQEAEIAWGSEGLRGLATVRFRGSAKEWAHTGHAELALDGSYLTTTPGAVTVDDVRPFAVGGLVRIGVDTAGGSGVRISAVDYANNTFTHDTTLDATHSSGDLVLPYNPTASTGGVPVHARIGMLSLDGSSTNIDHIGGRVTVREGRDLLNREVGHRSPSRVMRTERRDVRFFFDFVAKKNEVPSLLGTADRNEASNVQVSIGEGGDQVVLFMQNAHWRRTSVDHNDGASRIRMSGQALGLAGNDSLKARFRYVLANLGRWEDEVFPDWNDANANQRDVGGFWLDDNGFASASDSTSLNASRWS